MARINFHHNVASPSKGTGAGDQMFTLGRSQRVGVRNQVATMIRFASLCLIVYWLAIFALTHIPSSVVPKLSASDKIYHAGAFAGLAFLLAWAIPTRSGRTMRHLLMAGMIACGYACIDEFTQKFIPGRSCDIWDVAADVVGASIGLCVYVCCRQLLLLNRAGRQLIGYLSK